MRPPAFNIAHEVAVHSKAQNSNKFWRLALPIVLANLVFHITLWFTHLWQPTTLFSFMSFLFIVKPYRTDRMKQVKSKDDDLIQKTLLLINKEFKYSPNKGISKSQFIESRLINNVDFLYSGNRLINIKHDKFSISNIKVSHPSAIEFNTPFFEGVLTRINIPLHYRSYVLIRPSLVLNKSEIPEVFKQLFRRHMPTDAKKVYSNHKEFDNSFEIYTDYPQDWQLGLQDSLLNQLLSLNKQLLEIMHREKKMSKYILFTEHSLLKKSPLEISIVNKQIYLGIRNMKLFNIPQDSNNSETHEIIEKSISIIQSLHSIQF